MAQPKHLWQHFVVIGLTNNRPLQTVHGEPGFLGTEARYQPNFIDGLPHIDEALNKTKQPPPQLPTVLRELYNAAFVCGSSVPLPELINSLLAVPQPLRDGPQVCLRFGASRRVLHPPLATGFPAGEVPLQPLLEVLRPDNLVGLFAAVLLEQRVLLRSRRTWLLTVAAEGVMRLLQPLQYHHVYIPVMPHNLTDYLECVERDSRLHWCVLDAALLGLFGGGCAVQAPTPFLMGLHSGEPVDPHVLDTLVEVDLDADSVRPSRTDTLLQRCLAHPYMLQLRSRVGMLMQPAVTGVDAVGQGADPWTLAAQQMAGQPWGPSKQALLLRVFVEFFRSVLDGHQGFLIPGSCDGSRTVMCRALSGVQQGLLQMQKRASAVAAGSSSGAVGLPVVPAVRSSLLLGPLQPLCRVDLAAVLGHHAAQCGRCDSALLQQVMQGLPFLSFVAERGCAGNSHSWLEAAEEGLSAWRAAEEQQQAAHASQHAMLKLDKGTDVITIPQQCAHPLMPPAGLVHRSFPALVLVEYGDGPGPRLRRSGNPGKKRQSMGKRRAISELMGSQIDLRRRSPVPDLLSTELQQLQQLRPNHHDRGMETLPCTGAAAAAGIQPVLAGSGGRSSCAGGCGSGLSMELEEYSAEADVVRRQTALLVRLMQPVAGDVGSTDAALGCDALPQEPHEDLEAARRLLCLQAPRNRQKAVQVTGGHAALLVRLGPAVQLWKLLVHQPMRENKLGCQQQQQPLGRKAGVRTFKLKQQKPPILQAVAVQGCSWEGHVGPASFGVLADMLNSIIEVAAVQEDYRVVLAALELSCVITCRPAIAGAKRLLLCALAGNPVLHTEWLWAGTFSFAVSSSYLQAEELASIRNVVVACLADFARYVSGVGIPGAAAWLLLMQLGTMHWAFSSATCQAQASAALSLRCTCCSATRTPCSLD
ncbi:AEX-3 domain-containing protein [Scenedesmus sp. NREL 46B-D3]|nr:AEX-3 domain-containing protein [Scenedesmus sp. NREL 46B-D3]